MIKSKYIANILELLLDGDKEGLFARQQMLFLSDTVYDYTKHGLFVSFEHNQAIEKFRVEKADLILNGVKIDTDEYLIEADATLFFKEGLIKFLEIWCYYGDYPKKDLTSYTLTQIWHNSPTKNFINRE